jgi:hypothetical protein
MSRLTGSCLCGAVRYEICGPVRPVIYCHCSQCRKSSGHFVAASACEPKALKLVDETGLRWYASSPAAERGFCADCGANLFWRTQNRATVSIMAGTIDPPTGLQAIAHIFVDDASDYHVPGDGLPQYPGPGPDELDRV